MNRIREHYEERLEPIFDEEAPIRSTADMRTWYTSKHRIPTQKSQISHVVGEGGFGLWSADLLPDPALLQDTVHKHACEDVP